MAIAVSSEFKEVWARKAGKRATVQVRYKRRYFNDPNFVYETEWQVLDASEFETVGEIVNNLDTPFLNTFKTGALTLRLNNTNNEWIPSASSPSIFAGDLVAVAGYVPALTQFQVRFAYELPSTGDPEWVTLFTGLLTDLNFAGSDAGVEATIKSFGHLLETADSANVSTETVGEATIPGVADNVEKQFVTQTTGVARIDAVYVGGIIQNNRKYSVGNLATVGVPAKITFDDSPISGAITVDLHAWSPSQLVEDLIALLCDEAGILAGQRDIDPVDFTAGVDGFRSVDTQTNWNAGTVIQAVEAETSPGALRGSWQLLDDFSDNEHTTNPVWTPGNGPAGPISAISGKLSVQANAGSFPYSNTSARTPMTHSEGTWRFKMRNQAFVGGLAPSFKQQGVGFMTTADTQGYWLSFHPPSNQYQMTWFTGGTIYTLLGIDSGSGGAEVEWRITRSSSGDFKFYNDRVTPGTMELKASITHTGITTSTHFTVGAQSSSDDTGLVVVDEIYTSTIVENGTIPFVPDALFESEVFDIGLVPLAWGVLDVVDILNGDVIVYEVGVATSALGPFVYSPLGPGNQITSAVQQFFKIRATFNRVDNRAGDDAPEIRLMVANFVTTTILVSLAIFTGETVQQSIERFARLADYEFGFTGAGRFFFRAKPPVGVSVLTIDQENAIASITDYHPGYDEVITVGQVQQSGVFHEYDGADAGELSPTSEKIYGRIIRFEDYTQTLLRNDADIGRSRSIAIYKNNFVPKRRARIDAKIIPWIELGDTLTLDYFDHPLFRTTLWGDPLQKWGADFGGFSDPQNVLARGLLMKVVGVSFFPDKDDGPACELSLQEVLPS